MKDIRYFSSPIIATLLFFCACGTNKNDLITKSGLEVRNFERALNGDSTRLFVLRNMQGAEICITNYGGRIVSLWVPDRSGKFSDVVLGFDNINEYTAKPSSFGATIGRVANRIDHGKFVLDGDTVRLDINSGEHSIHGGAAGWQNQVFKGSKLTDSTLSLRYTSADGEGGFPGKVDVEVAYTLRADNSLSIRYTCTTDKQTPINLTNHSFFNLSGDPTNSILGDSLYVNADSFTPLRPDLITTGNYQSVTNTAFDFRKSTAIADALGSQGNGSDQLAIVGGIDHNFILNTDGDSSKLAASLYSSRSGILMDVYTDQPGLQVYTGNMLDGSRTGKKDIVYNKQAGICLESQYFPDSPNKPDWPSIMLQPGNTYKHVCVYRFSTR
ncbi:aldose epimerase family protein [Sphingobacterium deserti]|uniref:Aldose 1-epimerase n=1 Tax=Sphingobacterium deserti TaxID=1229276 RepID=A0A0B8T327_9SPHI|nr:aldose epimerase family protein [Sphingobacterium deserti]KGE13378.1 aldose 1-epimerase [Sphingobacterium deserti]